MFNRFRRSFALSFLFTPKGRFPFRLFFFPPFIFFSSVLVRKEVLRLEEEDEEVWGVRVRGGPTVMRSGVPRRRMLALLLALLELLLLSTLLPVKEAFLVLLLRTSSLNDLLFERKGSVAVCMGSGEDTTMGDPFCEEYRGGGEGTS